MQQEHPLDVYRTWVTFAFQAARWRARSLFSSKDVLAESIESSTKAATVEPVATTTSQPPDRWGQQAESAAEGSASGWLDSSWMVENHVWPLIFGEAPGKTWGERAAAAFALPRGRWLSIGCGNGNLELQMASNGLFDTMDAIDPSAMAVDVAKGVAASRGITNVNFLVGDANVMKLPASTYDVVHMNMALHHVSHLERLICQINKTLKPHGTFIANEFVGPNQFQFPHKQQELVKEILLRMPERLRWNPVVGAVKNEYPVYPRRHWRDWDPTESIRSDDIPRILKRNFPKMRHIPYGGTILNLLLENIFANFDVDAEEDLLVIKDLIEYEHRLLVDGVIQSDFAYFVCPRGSLLPRLRSRLASTLDLRRRVTMSLRSRMLA
ncbi:MAG: class I SAM-dependent methyltransferase [Actinobacteria bacterium]|nr:class I SAM-dependent methyltransferase [Actinomycetota bacterium]